MAGHSHCANISRKYARVDNVRRQQFGKRSRAIMVAVQQLDALEANDDTQNVTADFCILDSIMQEVMADA